MSDVSEGEKPPNEFSGFGYPETPTPVEVCGRDHCDRNRPLVTDLYCRDHGRFLPLINSDASARILLAIIVSVVIYGLFEISAQIDSQIPVYLVYAAVGGGLVTLPLRHYTGTVAITSVIWIIASIIPIVYRAAGSDTRGVVAGVISVIGILFVTVNAITRAPHAALPRSLGRDSRLVAQFVAGALIVAAGTAAASLLLRVEGYFLPDEHGISHFMLVSSLIALGAAVLILGVSSMAIGARRIRTDVWALPKPGRPRWVTSTLRLPEQRRNYSQNALDHIAETFARAIYVIAVSIGNALMMAGRIAVNCLTFTAYAVARAVVALINVAIRIIVLAARWAQAAIVTTAQLGYYAVSIALRCLSAVVISVIVPVSALVAAPWLIMAAANETRLYLTVGSLTALKDLGILTVAVVALLLFTWVILANQHPRESLRSFERSASITSAYGLIVIMVGGWLLGIPGTLGYGPIRVGWVTLSTTALTIAALLFYVARRRARQENAAPSAPHRDSPSGSPSRSDSDGRIWIVTMVGTVVAGAVIAVAIWAPWANLPVLQPTGLAEGSPTYTSVAISWSTPSSGPLPGRYVIMQNGAVIGSVPGMITSYRAEGLTPDTSYRYQVIAVRGAHRSVPSTLVSARTRTPHTVLATLTGRWKVRYSNLRWSGFNSSPGLTTDTWTFIQNCSTPPCSAALAGKLQGSSFNVTLHDSDAVYTGKARIDNYLQCGSTSMISNLTFIIRPVSAKAIGSQWVATSWRGTMVVISPASAHCNAAKITATISGTQ